MSISVLLPVSRFLVELEVGSGDPFSEPAKLALKLLHKRGSASLDEIAAFFALPRRLILEMLTGLFEEGWVHLETSGKLGLTRLGHDAAAAEKVPNRQRVELRRVSLALERLNGRLCRATDLYTYSKGALDRRKVFEDSLRLPAQYISDDLDEGQVHQLVKPDRGSWIRRLGAPTLEAKGWHWAWLGVDLDKGYVTGLPSTWEARLRHEILEWVGSASPELLQRAASVSVTARAVGEKVAAQRQLLGLRVEEDLLVGTQQHEARWAAMCKEPVTELMVCTPRTHERAVDYRLRRLPAGVKPDIFGEGAKPGLTDKARFSETTARMSLVIWRAGGEWNAIFGSYPWLGEAAADGAYVGLVVKSPEIIQDLCLSAISSMGLRRPGGRSPEQQRWLDLALTAMRPADGERPLDAEGGAFVELSHNQDRTGSLQSLCRTSQQRFAVWTDVPPDLPGADRQFETSSPAVTSRSVTANAAIGDITTVIGSSNWKKTEVSTVEVSLEVTDAALAELLWAKLGGGQ